MAPLLRIEHVYSGHREGVYVLHPAREKGSFLSGGGDGWIAEWSPGSTDGQLLAQTTSPVLSLAWAIEGQVLAAGTMDGKLHFIHPDSQEATRVFDLGGKASVYSLYFDGTHLWAGDGTGRLSQWAPEGQLIREIRISDRAIRSMVPFGDGELILGSSDGMIRRMDKAAGRLLAEWYGHDPSVFCLAQDPATGRLWSGGRDALLRQWDLEPGVPVQTSEIQAHWYTVNAIAFHPTLRIFATASRDKRIRLWGPDGTLLQSLDPGSLGGHVNSVNALWWSPGGERLTSAGDDRTVRSWILENELHDPVR